MRFLGWAATNVAILFGLAVAGLALMPLAEAIGWGDDDSRIQTYLYLWIILPLGGPLYLFALWHACKRVRHPRRAAILLTPLLWIVFPIAVYAITVPAVAATWVVYLTFGLLVRLGPVPARSGAPGLM